MKRIYLLSAALITSLICTGVNAQGPLYFGAKAGLMDADFSGFDEAANVGLNVGYDFLRESYGIMSIEGEYTTTLSDGEISGGGEWDTDTIAAYGVFRTNGEFYGKAKAGFLDQDIKRSGTGAGSVSSGDDSGFSYGIGGGWRMSRTSALELEYTVASDDLTFLSIGYLTRF